MARDFSNNRAAGCGIHRLALHAHLTGDLATARALYRDACDRGEAASCNNLGVLALLHPELARARRAARGRGCARWR
jgi:hypothetical protein